MKILFSPKCLEYQSPNHPESPKRISRAYEFLKKKGFEFIEPSTCSQEDILLVHFPRLLEQVRNSQFYDVDTPNIPGIFEYACLAAGSAIQAQELCLFKKTKAFSLMRPPGHHATTDNLGGFCYFNNIAIAMKRAFDTVKKAAILDLDGHHGNGTQDIFKSDKCLLYVSLHQSPLYPGTGLRSEDNCLNYPLGSGTDEETYLGVLKEALIKIKDFAPQILGISMGFDSFKLDPLTGLNLEISTYQKIGQMITQLNIPSFAVLEGGYSPRLGECIYEFILGWSNEPRPFLLRRDATK